MHHDGYALFESKYMNAFTSKQTHNRDFVKEYVNACRKAGLKVGLYKTLINWRFPGYYDVTGTDCKPNRFGYTTKPEHKENARLMKDYFLDGFKSDTFRLPPVDKGMKAIKAYDLCSGSKIRIDNRKNGITLKGLHLSDQELPVIAIEFNRPIYP